MVTRVWLFVLTFIKWLKTSKTASILVFFYLFICFYKASRMVNIYYEVMSVSLTG